MKDDFIGTGELALLNLKLNFESLRLLLKKCIFVSTLLNISQMPVPHRPVVKYSIDLCM